MLKVACIFSFKASSWVSCQKIVRNLHKSYEACSEIELKNFNFSSDIKNAEEIANLAQDIFKYNSDVISIIDHKPHPLPLLHHLSALYAQTKKKPKIIIHTFGDFSLFYRDWAKSASALENFQVEFVAASDRQKIYLDQFLDKNKSIVCPFPVDSSEFYPNQKWRNEQRSIWNLKEEDVAFIFTGRLSRQKRIKSLLSAFAEEFENDPQAHLFLYGDPDNIGDPFLGIKDMEGEYFRYFFNFYRSLPASTQKRIHFMGLVPNDELKKVYQGADIKVNLSVHNDEDFGMSVAEALAVGLPCALTDWGGLASFELAQIPGSVQFIPVKIGKRHKLISRTITKKILRSFFTTPHRELRSAISKAASEKFGLQRSTTLIESMLHSSSEKFSGFSPLFNKAVKAETLSPFEYQYLDDVKVINSLYREIYSAYVRTN